jgi:hypothetical protein
MDARAIFGEIHRSNMTKDPAPTNTFKKAVKGERFTKPDLAAVLLVAKLDLDVDIR